LAIVIQQFKKTGQNVFQNFSRTFSQ
jgi:hypothetical protein